MLPSVAFAGHSMTRILGWIIAGIVLVVMGVQSAHLYLSERTRQLAEMEQEAATSLAALAHHIAPLIEAYAVAEYGQLIRTEITQRRHLAIVVSDFNLGRVVGEQTVMTGLMRSRDGRLTELDAHDVQARERIESAYLTQAATLRDASGREIGRLSIHVSDEDLQRTLQRTLLANLLATAVVAACMILLLLWVIRRVFVHPLSRIADQIAQRDEDGLPLASFAAVHFRELNLLTSAMNEMMTVLRSTRDELRVERSQLRKLSMAVEQSPESVLITDAEGRIEYVNHAFERTTGYRRDEAIGQTPRMLRSEQLPTETFKGLSEALRAGEVWKGDLVNRRRDGSQYIARATIAPIRQLDGRLTHYLSVQEDITEKSRLAAELEVYRHHLERLVQARTAELEQARNQAQTASVAKSAFLANMSHEIRTPLNAITGMSYLLRQSGLSPAQSRKLERIEAAGTHLLEIIDAVLDLSKIEAGRFELSSETVQVQKVLDSVADMIQDRAREKGLSVRVEAQGLPAQLMGDATRLRQALLNYAGNAVKFTEQGRVTLRARLIESSETGELLHFEVEDTGIGISEAVQAQLFMPFQQADASITRQYGGTGLGLAITRRIAELMGGRAGVRSIPGQGSCFWFTAWLGRARVGRGARVGGEPVLVEQQLRQRHTGRRVLQADDDPVNQQINQLLLEAVGLKVETVTDGAAAVERAAASDYDLILMDMQMPVMDGLEAARRIRAQPGARPVPIVAVTANAFEADRTRCLEAGMNDVLTKPVSPRQLYALALRWLEEDRMPPLPEVVGGDPLDFLA